MDAPLCGPVGPDACSDTGSQKPAGQQAVQSTDVQGADRRGHDGRHRQGRPGALRPGPEEGRVRDLRRRRQAGHLVDDGQPRRPRHQRARGAAAAAARRDHPAAGAARCSDTSGRIFLFFVDDLHLQFQNTGRVRELFKKISKDLVHEGDMFGIVSSGPSSIAIDMTYDRKRLDEAIKKMTGNGLKPSEIINARTGREGPSEVRYRAHVAFSTMQRSAEEPREGAQPPQGARLGERRLRLQSVPGLAPRPDAIRTRRSLQNAVERDARTAPDNGDGSDEPTAERSDDRSSRSRARRSATRISRCELGEITRAANRANTTIYTIDPRGLVGRRRHRRAGRSAAVERSTCASRRTACACSPRRPAASPSST